MPLLETKGVASAQGFGGAGAGSSGTVNYIEDVFSTYLYTGNSSTQTITNGIDLAGEGGLVWTKARSSTRNHSLRDTVRGRTNGLSSNLTDANLTWVGLDSFNSNGYTLGDDGFPGTNSQSGTLNYTGTTYVSWTFREQPKFFDVVTYTGNGSNRTVSHNLGSVPGCIIVKRTDTTADWQVYHRSNANTQYMVLNSTAAVATGTTRWNSTTPTSTVFSLGTDSTVNASGGTYVAYLFAHNAGGFGLTGSDNVISCGSLTCGSGISTATLGYEPQWLLIKGSNNANSWWLVDNIRGLSQSGYNRLIPDDTTAETAIASNYISITSTGFTMDGSIFGNGNSFTYIAVRRGPMKVPTSGTEVFTPATRAGTGSSPVTTTSFGFPTDVYYTQSRIGNVQTELFDRLRGGGVTGLQTSTTNAEGNRPCSVQFNTTQDAVRIANGTDINAGSPYTYIDYAFRRAPGFFDEVCYTGNGTTQNLSHNLAAVPELMIVKARSIANRDWAVYFGDNGKAMSLNNTTASRSFAGWNYTTPTTSVFSLGADSDVNSSGATYVAYLFATCAGVSKVGSYTGTGALQTVNCGFTGGARFVLIKRTDSTGDWYVYDSARGISASNDPYLFLNSTSAEVTGTNYVDTDSTGFKVTAAAPAGLNANGGTYIFLAIA